MMQGMVITARRAADFKRRVLAVRAMTGSGLVLGVCLLALGQPVDSTARPQPVGVQTIDVEGVGPKAGDALPEFSLHAQDGKVHSLKSLLGANGAVIVFFRSADW
jgi:hypothetical protein